MAWRTVKNKAGTIATFAIGGAWITSFVPHTLGLDRYQKTLSNYLEDGTPQPMDPSLDELAQKVLYLLNLKIEHEKNLSLFMSYGVDPVSKGSMNIRTGAIVGIPHIFSYTEPKDVKKQLFQIYSEYSYRGIDWDSEAGEAFLNSMVLSEKAKTFGIARELKYAQSHGPFIEATMRSGAIASAFIGGSLLNQFILFSAPPLVQGIIFGGICLVGFALYISLIDYYNCWKDRRVDLNSARLSLEIAEGGVEFYEKMIQRNKAARVLLGKRGEYQYTVYGNERSAFRRPHLELSHRLQNAKKNLEIVKDNPPPEIKFDPESDNAPPTPGYGKVF